MPTVTLLNRASRQGTHLSASHVPPAGAAGQAVFALTLSDADRANPLKTCLWAVVCLAADGLAWERLAEIAWQGGPGGDAFARFAVELAELGGRRVYAEVECQKALAVGVTLTLP